MHQPLSSAQQIAGLGVQMTRAVMPTFENEKEKVVYYSASAIAERWCCSVNKVISVLEGHRGENGFMDLGAAEDVRKHKRKYAIIRIHPTLLTAIEASM